MTTLSYDYIIVGAGSAGCVLAARLTQDPSIRVLLIEAGGRDWHPLFEVPAGFARMTKGIASWGYSTVPQKHWKYCPSPSTTRDSSSPASTVAARFWRVTTRTWMANVSKFWRAN